jgi:hypothetical protein
MIIIWGERLYGKVDHVPGLCYVSTRFFHLWYIPLIPLQSIVIIDGTETEEGYRGVGIGPSPKSILCAWVRAAGLIAGIIYAIMLIVHIVGVSQGKPDTTAWHVAEAFGLATLAFGALYLSYRLSRPSLERTLHLGKTLGIEPEMMAAIVATDSIKTDDPDATPNS